MAMHDDPELTGEFVEGAASEGGHNESPETPRQMVPPPGAVLVSVPARDTLSEPPIIGTAAAGMTSPEPQVEIIPKQALMLGDADKYEMMHAQGIHSLVNEAMEMMSRLVAIEAMTTLDELTLGARDYERATDVASRLSGRADILDKKIDQEFVEPARKLWQNSLRMKKAVTGAANELLPKMRKALSSARMTIERKQKEIEEARLAELQRLEEERQVRIKLEREIHDGHIEAIKDDYARDLAIHEAKVRLYTDWDAALADDHAWDLAKVEARRKREEEDARIRQAEEAERAGATPARVEAILATPTPEAPVVAPPPPPAPKVVLPPPPPKPVISAAPYVPPPPVVLPAPVQASALTLNTQGKTQNTTKWRGRVLSKRKLLEAILEGDMPWESITINQGWFDAKATEGESMAGRPDIWEAYPEAGTKIIRKYD